MKTQILDILAASIFVLFPMVFIALVAFVAEAAEYFMSKK
jgi:hypothetical protein